jgi:PAS domain S-box-containing protein
VNESEPEKVSILLVDDRPGNLLSLSGVLERPDYDLVCASSGEEALMMVLKHEFAVILLDIVMPGMDGFEVASLLKQHERHRGIPILFVTASVEQIDWIFRAYSVGAVDFLAKPLDPHAVRAKVAVFVEMYRQKQQLKRHAALQQELQRRDRELAVARLRLESERRYRNLAQAIPHVVWTADVDGKIDFISGRWTEATGLGEHESLGRGWLGALHPDDRARADELWWTPIAAGEPFQVELRIRRRDGSWCWFRAHGLPELDENGARASWVGTLTDVDEEKRAQAELQAAVGMRDDFMSIASHELRTPLSALQLQLQSLERLIAKCQDPLLDERFARKLPAAVRQTDRLARLIDSLLDVSRIARGTLELQLEEFDLAEAVGDVVERFRDEAARAGSQLTVDLQPVLGRWDRLRIEQIATNLLSNAIKYGAGKPIEIAVEPAGDDARISVSDHGIGIDREKVDRIFERFERAVSTRHYGGLGLGLYIVRQIAQAHEGSIHVESSPGRGARFTITLPRTGVHRALSLHPGSAQP